MVLEFLSLVEVERLDLNCVCFFLYVAWDGHIIYLQVKGLSTEDLTTRNDLVLALPDRIQAIPDGTTSSSKKNGGWNSSTSRAEIKFDSGDALNLAEFRSTIVAKISFLLLVASTLH